MLSVCCSLTFHCSLPKTSAACLDSWQTVTPGCSLQPCWLAGCLPAPRLLQAPGLDDEYGVEAAQYLSELLGGGRRLPAVIERRERQAAGGKSWGAQVRLTQTHMAWGWVGAKGRAAASLPFCTRQQVAC